MSPSHEFRDQEDPSVSSTSTATPAQKPTGRLSLVHVKEKNHTLKKKPEFWHYDPRKSKSISRYDLIAKERPTSQRLQTQ
jgi:hypothetical protein